AIGARAAGPAAGGTAAAPIMSPARQTAPFSTSTPAAPAPATPDAIANVKRLVPDLNSTSVVQGAETLRRAALKDFKAAAIEMGARLQQAQQALEQAQKSGSQAEQEAAIKKLRDMQAQETAQIQRIAARLQSEMTALKQLKAGGK
ncbi:MAG: hypothetical protein KGR98_06860, partial [Verrucomicrobia bacterium]|nr:hypothetical protein [Verrucomicrobiota bacterium]